MIPAPTLLPVLASHTGRYSPLVELSSRSRLSSVCWSPWAREQLAAADYEGMVALWDVDTHTELMQVGNGLVRQHKCTAD